MDCIRRITGGMIAHGEGGAALCKARARRARRWARLVFCAALALFLAAAWQERALAPPLHDGMRVLAGRMNAMLDGPEGLRFRLGQALARPSTTGSGSDLAPITAWLLQWRN